MPKPNDLTGQRFGRWTAQSLDPVRAPDRQARWLCRCDCGAERTIKAGSLRSGLSKSCGCAEPLSTKHPLWRRWHNIVGRCTKPTHPDYVNYGARGITVCERWLDFANFISDMEPTYKPGLCVERVDNNRGYEPANCVWATMRENIRNRRSTVILDTPWGRMSQGALADKIGMDVVLLDNRVRSGWPMSRLLDPANRKKLTRWARRPDHLVSQPIRG